MFNESGPWKRELLASAHRLREAALLASTPKWPPGEEADNFDPLVEAVYSIERDVMVGCFSMRRLLGMPYKVSQEVRARKVEVTLYPLQPERRPPDSLDALDLFDWYDMTRPATKMITTQQLCNLFVHSHVLHFAWDLAGISPHETAQLKDDDPRLDGPIGLGGFYVATDKGSTTHLTRVDLDVLTDEFEAMGSDDVIALSWTVDHRGKRHLRTAQRAAPGEWEAGIFRPPFEVHDPE